MSDFIFKNNVHSIKEIVDNSLLYRFPLIDTSEEILRFLGSSPDRRSKSLERIFTKTCKDYQQFFRIFLLKSVSGIHITFVNNVENYVSGQMTENYIELIPDHIATIQSVFATVSPSFYVYRAPNLQMAFPARLIKYAAAMPYKLNFAPDGYITEDSWIYGLNLSNSTSEYFQTYFDYNLINYLNQTFSSVVIPNSNLATFNFDSMLDELKEEIEIIEKNASTQYTANYTLRFFS